MIIKQLQPGIFEVEMQEHEMSDLDKLSKISGKEPNEILEKICTTAFDASIENLDNLCGFLVGKISGLHGN